jgi:hypothetical protein
LTEQEKLLDPRFRIDLVKQNEILAFRCLVAMNNELKFDILKIHDRSLLNEEVENLSDRINDNMSEALRYSCRFFTRHIAHLLVVDGMVSEAWEEFVSKHLLHWIEAMSWLGRISEAESCLRVLAAWMKVRRDISYIIADV